MTVLKDFIRRGKRGESVWLPEVRETFEALKEFFPLIIRHEGEGTRDYKLKIPFWTNEEEREFLTEYISDTVFNIISLLGGERVEFYTDENEAVSHLLIDVFNKFQLEEPQRTLYGKCVSVANRINASLGKENIKFIHKNIKDYVPAGNEKKVKKENSLPDKLFAAVNACRKGIYCGIDVGGTDIKFALSVDGELKCIKEYDWNPSVFTSAEEIIAPIIGLAREASETFGANKYDGIGISFPDVVINDKIVGGETPKTAGLREKFKNDYEKEFSKLSVLKERLAPLCNDISHIKIVNDGTMTAISAAAELVYWGRGDEIAEGVFAHSLGTDLGTGYFPGDGTLPRVPLEMYDLILELGAYDLRKLPGEDIRAICNENSHLPGARRYMGQAAAYRYAYELDEDLLEGFIEKKDNRILIKSRPTDMRKPCLEHLMQKVSSGDEQAQNIFLQIGRNLARVTREGEYILGRLPQKRFLFGRFVKHGECFECIKKGFEERDTSIELIAAGDNLAFTPLMAQLKEREDITVAQFAQAVGAIYLTNL